MIQHNIKLTTSYYNVTGLSLVFNKINEIQVK